MPESSLLPVGRIRKAHGIRGEVSVDYHADSPALLRDGVFLQHGTAAPVFYEVAHFRAHHGSLLLRFTAISDRTAAETLRGHDILIPEARLPEPEDGIYIYQLLGFTVVAVEENGAESIWGTISAIEDPAGQELWTISQEGEADVLFPATEELVLGFDPEKRIARIAPPPGLIDLYRS
ncbi:ribosome maturation factor RimM [Desulfovibrio sp. OttesenSCG-928-O18]|nr:ribosome maturation factor RimM [Desulfovibrio sp. OttesenSCG-928-O18]